jgi:peptidoglycan-associated lipoprotein
MGRKPRRWLISTLSLSLLIGACAKRPAFFQESAPAPTGIAGTTAAAPEAPPQAAPEPRAPAAPEPSASAGSGRGPASTRPAPGEFNVVPELEDIHFAFDKYDLRPGDAKILEENARWLKANPPYLLLIEGHADERGTNAYNLALADRRARTAMDHLVAHGVRAGRITTISYGEERPACIERTEACWASNRRAHFLTKPG